MHEGRRQTNTGPAHAGSRLKLSDALGRRRPKCHPSSRTGENPPYGMIGGIEETSASFEARSAPRSYPTAATSFVGLSPSNCLLRSRIRRPDLIPSSFLPQVSSSAGVAPKLRSVLTHDRVASLSRTDPTVFVK